MKNNKNVSIQFRSLRSTLEESLKTLVSINSKVEFIAYHNKEYEGLMKILDVKCHYVRFDERSKWNTWKVLGLYIDNGELVWTVIGWSDSEIK